MATPQHFQTEAETASAFDLVIDSTGLFVNYPEVRGTLLQPRPRQVDKTVRIDRVLTPTNKLLDLGWAHGIIGVELKRSGKNAGGPLNQALDYSRSVWTLPHNYMVMLSWVFVFPMETQHGPLASLMAQHRVGTAESNDWTSICFKTNSVNLLRVSRDGTVRLTSVPEIGTKVGSR